METNDLQIKYNQLNNFFLYLKVESFSPEVEVRAVLESQFLARLMYAKQCGLKIGNSQNTVIF